MLVLILYHLIQLTIGLCNIISDTLLLNRYACSVPTCSAGVCSSLAPPPLGDARLVTKYLFKKVIKHVLQGMHGEATCCFSATSCLGPCRLVVSILMYMHQLLVNILQQLVPCSFGMPPHIKKIYQ